MAVSGGCEISSGETAGFFVDCREADPYITDILKADLGAGESAAIAQADKKESILLIDDEKAYKRAIKMEIRVIRTGRLLNLLKEAGAIREVRPYHEKLAKLGFYMSKGDFRATASRRWRAVLILKGS
jgi:predicted nucleic acid-binding protein